MRDSRSALELLAKKPARIITCGALAVALSLTPAISPIATAYATSEQTQTEINNAQSKIEEATSAYNDSVAKLDEIQTQIEENEARIAQIEEELPQQQEKASAAMKSLYKYNQGTNPVVSLLCGSGSISDFFSTVAYSNSITESSSSEIEELNSMQSELEQAKVELEQAKVEQETEKKNAEESLATAQELKAEAEAKAAEENAAALVSLSTADVPEGSGVSGDNSNSSATDGSAAVNTTPISDADTTNSDYTTYMNTWTTRINNYLAGSPLAGYGQAFAQAAWNTGADPRWSPAISCVESTKGTYCANSYNAWGWSSASGGWRAFGSWDEAISLHVAYLASFYGGYLTPSAAKTYCPPTWQDWYNKVASEMNRI